MPRMDFSHRTGSCACRHLLESPEGEELGERRIEETEEGEPDICSPATGKLYRVPPGKAHYKQTGDRAADGEIPERRGVA